MNFSNAQIDFVQTPIEAIELLKTNKYNFLFLDHDLGGKIHCPSDQNSGYAVAKWLEENPQFKPTEDIILHTYNTVGCYNMKAALPEAIILPSVWTLEIDFDTFEHCEEQSGVQISKQESLN